MSSTSLCPVPACKGTVVQLGFCEAVRDTNRGGLLLDNKVQDTINELGG